MKTTLDLRPIFHRREDRIRAHVLLCWLSLLLIRIAENATGETWRTIRTELDKLHLGRFAGPAGEVSQRTETTPPSGRDLHGRRCRRAAPLLRSGADPARRDCLPVSPITLHRPGP